MPQIATVPASALLHFGVRFLEVEGAAPNDNTREVPVIIIKEGMGNKVDRHFYSAELLARVASKFNGAKAYADHPTKTEESDQPERSVRQIVGYYNESHVETIGGKAAIVAKLKIIEGASYDWAWQLVKEAFSFSKKFAEKELVGISINAYGTSHVVEADGGNFNMVDDLTEVQSADIVTQAGAGGGFRLREGANNLKAVKEALSLEGSSNGGKTMSKKVKEGEAVKPDFKGMLAKHGEGLKALRDKIKSDPAHEAAYGPAMDEVLKHHAEMEAAAPAEEPAAHHAEPDGDEGLPPEAIAKPAEEAFKRMEQDYKDGKLKEGEKFLFETLVAERAERAIRESVAMIAAKIKESGIPEAYQGDLAVICAGKSEADVTKIVEARKALVAPLMGNRGQGAGAGSVSADKSSKLQEKLASSGIKMKEAAKA